MKPAYLVTQAQGRQTLTQALDSLLEAWHLHYNVPPAALIVPDGAPDAPALYRDVPVWQAATTGLRLQPAQVAAGPVDSTVVRT